MTTLNNKTIRPEDVFDHLDALKAQAERERAAAFGKMFVSAAAGISSLVRKIAAYRSHRAAAAELMAMDDRMLADIGIGRSEIQATIAGRLERGAANSNDVDRDAA